MIRLHIPHDLAVGAVLALDPGQSRYLSTVMRQAVGDELLLFNGRNGEWRSAITVIGKRAVGVAAISQERPQDAGPDLDLIIALVKRGRLETIVEKAAELGARRVRLVSTARTNAERIRVERLTLIATEAAEQTGRLDVPLVSVPETLDSLLAGWSVDGQSLLFCDEAGDAPPALAALTGREISAWAILIGPEGGFSPAERAAIRALRQTVPASLGPRILRADTAAIAAMTLWQSMLGDWRRA